MATPSETTPSTPVCGQKVVIIGGGIIGCSVAYHLAQLGVSSEVTILECHKVAGAASGRVSGFIARQWTDMTPLQDMSRHSYELHRKYGALFDVDYRILDAYTADYIERQRKPIVGAPVWLDGKPIGVLGNLAEPGEKPQGMAQVHPRKLTEAFCKGATDKGATVVIDKALGVEMTTGDDARVTGVKLASGKTLPCDSVVIAMGPWTYKAHEWFPELPIIQGQKMNYFMCTPSRELTAEAVYVSWPGQVESTEIHPRVDGEVHVCGFTEDYTTDIPEPSEETPNMASIDRMKEQCVNVSSALKDGKFYGEQSFYLPISPGTRPFVGKIPKTANAYVAAGHTHWNILNAPLTGVALADLMVTGHSEFELRRFAPDYVPPR